MLAIEVFLGSCCLALCSNEAHYICDDCEDEFCNDHMITNELCFECYDGKKI